EYQTVERPALVAKFMEVYRKHEAEDFETLRLVLAEHFHRDEYKSSVEVEAGFDFDYQYVTFSVPDKLSSFSSSIVQREQKKAESLMLKAAEEVRAALRASVASMVDKLVEVLKPGDD